MLSKKVKGLEKDSVPQDDAPKKVKEVPVPRVNVVEMLLENASLAAKNAKLEEQVRWYERKRK